MSEGKLEKVWVDFEVQIKNFFFYFLLCVCLCVKGNFGESLALEN